MIRPRGPIGLTGQFALIAIEPSPIELTAIELSTIGLTGSTGKVCPAVHRTSYGIF